MIIHDDTPCMMWKLAVIEELVGRDGLMRAAIIRTANGMTSRPISKLYPLELASGQVNHTVEEVSENSGTPDSDSGPMSTGRRPSRAAVRRATDKVKEWTRILSAPPEDVTMDKHCR